MEAASAEPNPRVITSAHGEKSVVTAERIGYRQCLTPVRAFYLDLSQWAIEDPSRWAQWVAACPVGQEEISQRKFQRHRKARMDARTRERLPVLPVLVRTVDERRRARLGTPAGRQPNRAEPGIQRRGPDTDPFDHQERREGVGRRSSNRQAP